MTVVEVCYPRAAAQVPASLSVPEFEGLYELLLARWASWLKMGGITEVKLYGLFTGKRFW